MTKEYDKVVWTLMKQHKERFNLFTKKIARFGISLLLLLAVTACGADQEDNQTAEDTGEKETQKDQNKDMEEGNGQNPVAVVNGEEISREELERTLNQLKQTYAQQGLNLDDTNEEMLRELEKNVLNQLINTELIIQAATSAGIEPTSEEINETIEQLTERYGGEEELEKALDAYNLTVDGLKESIADEMKVNKYIAANVEEVAVTEEEMEELYNEYAGQSEEFPAYEDIKAQLEQEVKSQKQQVEVQKLVDQLREDSKIEILV